MDSVGCNTSCAPIVYPDMERMIELSTPEVLTYTDIVFAPLDRDHQLRRLAGGNETDVYITDDDRYVVKLKHDLGDDAAAAALAHAREMRVAAEQFVECLGHDYTIANFYVVSRDGLGRAQVLAVQPFVEHARPLYSVDVWALSHDERRRIAAQLRDVIRRSLAFYRATGSMPDLYGRSTRSAEARKRANGLWRLPERLWSFLIDRNLLRSHNLLISSEPDRSIRLVDYDFVRRGRLYRLIYFAVRWLLFWRDRALLWWLEQRA